MHIHFLDTYQPGTSSIHRWDARVKLVLAIAFIMSTAISPAGIWPVYIILYSLILSVELLSEQGIGFYFKRALLAIPFVFAALPLIFTSPGERMTLFSFGWWAVDISVTGVVRFLSIALKSWISVQAAVVLATCTPFHELLAAMRAVGIPRLLVSIFQMMWRYLFVLIDEALRLLRARQARSSQSDLTDVRTGGSIVWRANVTGGLAGSLLLRALERSDRIYSAMLARGYDGEVRGQSLARLSSNQLVILIAGLFILGFLMFIMIIFTR